MTRALHLVGALALVTQAFAQTESNPFIKEGSIGTGAKPTCPQDANEYRAITCWVGESFIFLPRPVSLQRFGYQSFTFEKGKISPNHPGYESFRGRVAIVEQVEKGKYTGWDVAFRMKDDQTIVYAHASFDEPDDASVNGIAPLRELEAARDLFKGKTIWTRFDVPYRPHLGTYDADTDDIGEVAIARATPLEVTDVVAGWYENAPVRLLLRTPSGALGFKDLSLSGTNVSRQLRGLAGFDTFFFREDPRKAHPDWSAAVWQAIDAGKVAIGMTAEQARMSWGKPKDVNRTTAEGGVREQWVYSEGEYLYVEQGKVVAIRN